MTIRNSTKYAFADAMKKLLTTKDLCKVRVKEICDLCGAERPTFYYHFQDKYALIAWIYEQDFRKASELAGGYHNVIELENLLFMMQKERIFYQKAFQDVSQNTLYEYMREVNFKLFTDIVKKQQQTNVLTPQQEFTMNFYIHAWLGCLFDWINDKYDVSAKEYASWVYDNIKHLKLSDIKAENLGEYL